MWVISARAIISKSHISVADGAQGRFGDIAGVLRTSMLSELRVARNRISGSLDEDGRAALCSMTRQSLQLLDATDNAIGGPLPPCLLGAGELLFMHCPF